jgi:hypothetical protein
MNLRYSFRHFLLGETVITIQNRENLDSFLARYHKEFSNYEQPPELRELLEVKREGALYPFHMIIRGRINKKLEMWHQHGSKYQAS